MKQLISRYYFILFAILFPIISLAQSSRNNESVVVIKKSISKFIENKNDSLFETELIETHLLLNDFMILR